MRTTCTWKRYLAYDYEVNSGVVTAFIATNSLPNYCFYQDAAISPLRFFGNANNYNAYVWSFVFNQPLEDYDTTLTNNAFTTYTTQATLESAQCDQYWATSPTIDANIDFIWTYHDGRNTEANGDSKISQ